MVRVSYVKGTSFVGVNSSESEDVVMQDVKVRLTCPHLGTLRTERLTCPLPRNTEHVNRHTEITCVCVNIYIYAH